MRFSSPAFFEILPRLQDTCRRDTPNHPSPDMYDPGRAAVSPTQSEEDRAADTTFHEDLMHLFGEVPTERIVDKIRGKLGDEDAEMHILMGRMAF